MFGSYVRSCFYAILQCVVVIFMFAAVAER